MSHELLPRFNRGIGMNSVTQENFLRNVRRFTTAQWRQYEALYSDRELPLGVITVGPDFIASGRRVRHYGKHQPVSGENVTVALNKLGETTDFGIGSLVEGATISDMFRDFAQNGKLQSSYTLFATDTAEWTRIRGNPVTISQTDDFSVLRYDVEGQGVEVWAFDVLDRTIQQPLAGDNSDAITTFG